MENLDESKTVNKFTEMIGRGSVSIHAAAEIARHVAPQPQKRSYFSKAVLLPFSFDSSPQLHCNLSLSLPCPVEVDDFGIPHKAIDAFASLGSAGSHPGNEERDLHRWMRNLWGLTLEPYTIYCDLEVLCLHLLVLFFSSNRILSGRPWVV